ncbi:MAG: DUF853 family protein, partial [Bacteroidetes bacterium]|nr:DUF853 family protein [Bacteroidota bacterium]
VGIFFCTQNPMDVSASVLSQLGLKIQHALRAFTAADRKTIVQTAANYPETTFYKTEDLITELGIGEALVTALNEKGIPTPLVQTMLLPPRSRMDILSPQEIQSLVNSSVLVPKYNKTLDSDSAFEILNKKIEAATTAVEAGASDGNKGNKEADEAPSFWDSLLHNTVVKSMMRTAGNALVRNVLGSFMKRR